MIEVERSARWASAGGPSLSSREIATAASKLISASIGEIAVIMAKTPDNADRLLSDISAMVVPAVLSGQFYVVEAISPNDGTRAPAAFVTWASVTDEVDRRLRGKPDGRIRLKGSEWSAGDNLWIVDMAGDPGGLRKALNDLRAQRFKDRTINIALVDDAGMVRFDTIANLAAGEAA